MVFETPALTAPFWDGVIAQGIKDSGVPGLTVNKLVTPGSDRTAYAKQLIAAGTEPDLMQSISTQDFVDSGLLQPWDQKWSEENFILPMATSIKGKIWQAPTNSQIIPLVFYNKDLFKQVGVEYKRAARISGETKYPFRKMFRLALNAITSFSYFPLQVATFFGFASAGIAIIAIPVVVALRLAGSHFFEGQTTTLISVLFLGGVQLISLGILGEYVGRLYDEAKGRPLYIVRDAPKDQ